MSELSLRLVRDPGELEVLREDWLKLLSRSATNEPMLSPLWLLPWWRVYGQHRQLTVGLLHDGDDLVGLAPFHRRRYWYRPGIPFRRLEPLGADVDEQDGVCSEYLNVIARAGDEERVARRFALGVRERAFGSWDEVVMPYMAGDCPMTDLLLDSFQKEGFLVSREQTTSAPYIPLPAKWDEYLKVLPKRHRYFVVRSLRDFEDWAAGSAVLREVRAPADLEEGKRILTTLHNERWHAAATEGAFARQRFVRFHDEVLPLLLGAGSLEMLWLTVRGEPVAVLYNVVWNNKVTFYQFGRKVDVPRHVRPGIALLCMAMRRAIEAGRREFDFLGGESMYKSQLALAARPLVQLRFARRTLREGCHRLAEGGVRILRRVRQSARSMVGWLRSANGVEKKTVVPAAPRSL